MLVPVIISFFFFFFQAEDGIRDVAVTGVQTCALPISYDDMADAELQRIVADALQRWPSARIALRHRLGHVAVGEPSIAIVTAAPHRAQAFEACRYVIEEVKRRLPVWKKELRADGTEVWVDPSGRPTAGPPARPFYA